MKLVRSESVIKPIQWLESALEIYLFLNVVAMFSGKLGINGKQLKSNTFDRFYCCLTSASCEVKKLYADRLHLLCQSLRPSKPVRWNVLTEAKIKSNKHAWHINYTTGDFEMRTNWKEVKKLFSFFLFLGMQMLILICFLC